MKRKNNFKFEKMLSDKYSIIWDTFSIPEGWYFSVNEGAISKEELIGITIKEMLLLDTLDYTIFSKLYALSKFGDESIIDVIYKIIDDVWRET